MGQREVLTVHEFSVLSCSKNDTGKTSSLSVTVFDDVMALSLDERVFLPEITKTGVPALEH